MGTKSQAERSEQIRSMQGIGPGMAAKAKVTLAKAWRTRAGMVLIGLAATVAVIAVAVPFARQFGLFGQSSAPVAAPAVPARK